MISQTMTGKSTRRVILEFGYHRYRKGAKPAKKGCHAPCLTCGASERHSVHKGDPNGSPKTKNVPKNVPKKPLPEASVWDPNMTIACPICGGHGTVKVTIRKLT